MTKVSGLLAGWDGVDLNEVVFCVCCAVSNTIAWQVTAR